MGGKETSQRQVVQGSGECLLTPNCNLSSGDLVLFRLQISFRPRVPYHLFNPHTDKRVAQAPFMYGEACLVLAQVLPGCSAGTRSRLGGFCATTCSTCFFRLLEAPSFPWPACKEQLHVSPRLPCCLPKYCKQSDRAKERFGLGDPHTLGSRYLCLKSPVHPCWQHPSTSSPLRQPVLGSLHLCSSSPIRVTVSSILSLSAPSVVD